MRFWIVLAVGLAAPRANAQQPQRLQSAAATLDHEFSRITSARELADGRLLVVDAGERVLTVADFQRNLVRQVGREGRGPGEYSRLGAMLPLPGDSTLLVDLGGARYLLLRKDSIVVTVPPDSPAHQSGATLPIGADGAGRVLATRAMASPPGRDPMAMPGRTDSTHLVRVHRSTGAADTLATLRARETRIRVSGARDNMTTSITFSPLATGELATAFQDGWVVIARMDPYRVEWRSPDGRLTSGPDLGHARRAPSLAEKRAAMERLAASRGAQPDDPATRDDWPEFVPPFLAGALIPTAGGQAWIRRLPDPAQPVVDYDIIDRRGQRTAVIRLPDTDQVVAVGREWVYVARADEDGLQQLRRHPLPR